MKKKINEDTTTGSDRTMVNIRKGDLADSSVTTNLKKLGADVSVNVVDEEVGTKTIKAAAVHKLAQKAGNFSIDAKEALIRLIMIGDDIPLDMVKKTIGNYDLKLSDLKGQDATFKPSAEFANMFNSSLGENIKPTDTATIKYLSNVKDDNGGVSKPFSIDGKNYQMVRGMQNKKVVMGVFCHDDINESGENIIHSIEEFENNIAKPMLEKENQPDPIEESGDDELETSMGLGKYKHFVVNERTKKFRKFETLSELASANMGQDETYKSAKEFKQFFEETVFGGRKPRTKLDEIVPTPEDGNDDIAMNAKAKRLMVMISKKIPSNVIETIVTPVAQREVIAAFAELIGVPRTGLATLISGLKDLANTKDQPITENKKVLRTIKVKDLK